MVDEDLNINKSEKQENPMTRKQRYQSKASEEMTEEEKEKLAEKRKQRNEAKLEYKRKLREKRLHYGYADKDGNY